MSLDSVRDHLRFRNRVFGDDIFVVDGVKRNLHKPFGEKTRSLRVPDSLRRSLISFLSLYAESDRDGRHFLDKYLFFASDAYLHDKVLKEEEKAEEEKAKEGRV
jgi:hypothetical protein